MMFFVIIVIGFLLYQYLAPAGQTYNTRPTTNTTTARETLDLRLAKGEISVDEYNDIKQAL